MQGPVHHSVPGTRIWVQKVFLGELVCYCPGVHLVGNSELTTFGTWRTIGGSFRGVSVEMVEQRSFENGPAEACSVRFSVPFWYTNQIPTMGPPDVCECFQ